MVTNDERREAAARLRKMTPEWMGLGGWRFYLKPRLGISAIIQVTEGDPRNVSNALADLIEPEPERTCHMTHDESASRAMCGPAVRCSAYGLSCVAAVALVASAQPGDPPGPEPVPEVRGRTPPVAAYVDEG